MSHPAPPPAAHARPPGLQKRFRTRITAGMILVVPVWVTFLIISFVFGLLRDTSLWLLEALFLTAWGARLVVKSIYDTLDRISRSRPSWTRGRLRLRGARHRSRPRPPSVPCRSTASA